MGTVEAQNGQVTKRAARQSGPEGGQTMDYTDIIADENETVKAPRRKPCEHCEGNWCAGCKHQGGANDE